MRKGGPGGSTAWAVLLLPPLSFDILLAGTWFYLCSAEICDSRASQLQGEAALMENTSSLPQLSRNFHPTEVTPQIEQAFTSRAHRDLSKRKPWDMRRIILKERPTILACQMGRWEAVGAVEASTRQGLRTDGGLSPPLDCAYRSGEEERQH